MDAGSVRQFDTPEALSHRPADLFVAQRARFSNTGLGGSDVEIAGDGVDDQPIELRVAEAHPPTREVAAGVGRGGGPTRDTAAPVPLP